MKRILELLRFDGTIDRRPYFIWVAGLVALAIGLEYLVYRLIMLMAGTPFDAPIDFSKLWMFDRDSVLRWMMVVLVLPFVAGIVALTVRRLRSAGLPVFLAVLVAWPSGLSVIVFLILAMLPSEQSRAIDTGDLLDSEPNPFAPPPEKAGLIGPRARDHFWRAAFTAILIPIPFAIALGFLSFDLLRSYGWTVFLGIPFVLPMISVIIFGYNRECKVKECLYVGLLWLATIYASMLVLKAEGMICLLMALPLVLPIVLLGSWVGYLIQRASLVPDETRRLLIMLTTSLPLLIGAESAIGPEAPIFKLSSSVEIDASPQRVWDNLIQYEPMPAPQDWFFRAGVAYPVAATLEGRGVGAIRQCVFSTGPAIEAIDVWHEPRELAFAVTRTPPPMREWNPLGEIHPAHLDSFLVSRRAEFRLSELPGGRTRLEGTSWYQHHLAPAAYWRLWTDFIIGRIHERVYEHVKRCAEGGSEPVASVALAR
jgi:uncharacterized membrane protein YhaH (DUF805 family)